MLKRILKILDLIGNWTGYLLGAMVFLLMVMVLVEVVTRYLMQSPLAIADEFGGYMLVAITFMGLGYTWKEKGHVRVEFLINSLSKRKRDALRVLTLVIATGFAILLTYASWEFVSYTSMFKLRSGSWLRIPLKWPQMTMIIGAVLLSLQLIADLISTVLSLQGDERSQ